MTGIFRRHHPRNRPGRFYLRLLLVPVLASCLVTAAADYQAGLDAYQRGDFDAAIREWQAVAESPPGTVAPEVRAETLYAIGMLYWIGQGVRQDTAASAEWLALAADMGHAGAQGKLGFLYLQGQGVQQSDFEALKWFRMAAEQDDADAQYNLGVIYRDGLGVDASEEASMKWFRKAAANGDPVSAEIVARHDARRAR